MSKPCFQGVWISDKNPLSRHNKKRWVDVPNEAAREVGQNLLFVLRESIPDMPYAAGGLKGCSSLKNVERHRMSRFFCLYDIQSAFPSLDMARLFQVVQGKMDLRYVLNYAARTFFDKEEMGDNEFIQCFGGGQGGLAVGGPASDLLFNLYCHKFVDTPISELCRRYGVRYTRYTDDLTFSHTSEAIGKEKRRKIREVITAAGFKISHRKAEVLDLKRGPIVINGIGLAYNGPMRSRLYVPRHYCDSLMAEMGRALTGKLSDVEIKSLQGKISTFVHITPHDGKFLNRTERRVWDRIKQFWELFGR